MSKTEIVMPHTVIGPSDADDNISNVLAERAAILNRKLALKMDGQELPANEERRLTQLRWALDRYEARRYRLGLDAYGA